RGTAPGRLMALGTAGWALCLALLAAGLPAAPMLLAAGLLMGLPIGVIMALPAQVLRPEQRAIGMGLFYVWLYIGHGGLPPLAGWLQDATGSAAAPLLLCAVLVLALLPMLWLFRAGAAAQQRAEPSTA
ncbi:hypothetical protein, partial [Falsiroseomonas oryziterrae]